MDTPHGPPHGLEAMGIERVPPEARSHVRVLDNFTMWLSANLVISTVALGGLAVPVFKLGFWDSIAVIAIFNLLGILPVAFFATLGARLGLRQMTISRFSFGWAGAIVMASFNVAALLGWSVVNVVVGGQLVEALSGGYLPCWLGIVIITALTTIVSIYGYRFVHRYERFAWMPMAAIFTVIFAVSLPHFTLPPTPRWSATEAASLVSFGGAIFGFCAGWSSYAADYTVHQPQDTPPRRIFWLTYAGILTACVPLETLGLALTTLPGNGVRTGGDLIAAAVMPLGQASRLVLLLLALSVIANNIPNDYSLGLTVQVLGKRFQYVARHIWTLLGSVIYASLAIPAAARFSETLTDFLLIIAYWLAPWATVLILDYFLRKGKYDVDDWDRPERLPKGWAAMVAMACGLVGVGLGAAQARYTGPLARLVGPHGMDVGFEAGVLLTAVTYLALRPLEWRQKPVVSPDTDANAKNIV